MTATIAKINAKIARYGVEIVKGKGYFYFADIGDEFAADRIPSVYSAHLRCMTLDMWVGHVESALRD